MVQGNLSDLRVSLVNVAGSVAGWESVRGGTDVRVLRSTKVSDEGHRVTSYEIGAGWCRLNARSGCMFRVSARFGFTNETCGSGMNDD